MAPSSDAADGSDAPDGRFARGALVVGLLAIWVWVSLAVGVGRSTFFFGASMIGGGYLLLRLVHAVERLAVAAERLGERRE